MKKESEAESKGKPVILLVEDSEEVMELLVSIFSSVYIVYKADNGQAGYEQALNIHPDIVVSDVMMPQMDGFELCKTIKSDLSYSHIPVVLLTAKTNIQSKIEGLELGADAYIEKPFSVEYLLANISSLIHNREKLRQTFAKSPFVAANTMNK